MNAGIIPDIQPGSVVSGGGGILTLGSGGELQVEGSSVAQPYVVPDGDGPFAGISVFSVTTVPATLELAPSLTTSVPGMANSVSTILSQGTSSFSPPEDVSTLVETPTATASSSSESGQEASMGLISAPTSTSPAPSLSAKGSALNTPVSITTSTATLPSWAPSTISRSFTSSLASSSYISVQSIVIASSSSFLSSSTFSTSSGVSTATSTNSSSTTLNSQTSQTIFAPINTNASNLNVHRPPFYIAVVLGTIAGIALLAVLIAWLIRYKTMRRRAARIVVPWARFDGENDGRLVARHGDVDRLAVGAMHLGNQEDLAHIHAWSLRGYRDVGEPRNLESYMNGSTYSSHNHTVPSRTFFSDESSGALSAFEGYSVPGLRPNHTFRQIPSHLMDESFAFQAIKEEAHAQYYGPMPERIINGHSKASLCNSPPQSLALGSPTCPLVERSRNLDKPREPFLKDIGPLPTPGAPQSGKGKVEPWASTFKTRLVKNFDSVGTNFSPVTPRMELEGDRLTALPRFGTRRSVRDVFCDEKLHGSKGSFLYDSTSAIRSQLWTVEEKADDSDVVHLHVSGEEIPRRPSMVQPNLSFGDGESTSSYDDHGLDFRRIRPADSQIPLTASSKPPLTFIQPEAHYSKGSKDNVDRTQASRESSIYSTFPGRRRTRVDTL